MFYNRKFNYLKNLQYKRLNFWREIRIKDIHQREDKIPAQSLSTTTLDVRKVTQGTIHILCNQSRWVGGVGQMIMSYAKKGSFINEL